MAGVISAGDPYTAEAGAEILRQGGNAVDAAVAAAFTSFLSEIAMVHLGGSGLAHLFLPQLGRSVVYDFFSNMPGLGRSTPLNKALLDFQKVTVNFGSATQDFYIGRGSVAVPGNIFGLCQMNAEHGRLPLAQVLEPALRLAKNGVKLTDYQARTCHLLTELFTHTEEIKQIFAHTGRMIEPGDTLFIPNLHHTLSTIAQEGDNSLRHGRLGEILVADQLAQGGLVTAEDLQKYQVYQADPIRLKYRDYEIFLPNISSVGGVLIAFTLKLLHYFAVGQFAHGSADHLQLLTEAMSATTRARRHLDLAMLTMPAKDAVARFLDDEFIGNFAAEAAMALWKGRPSQMILEPEGKPNTSHLSVIDQEGMAVSLTTTAGESAGFVVPGTGFIPNNMLGEEDLHPNGFHNMPAGERIHTMMCPVIVLKEGKIKLVTGSGGSIRIRTAVTQVISNVLDFNLPLAEAVNSSRVHLENRTLHCEGGYQEAAVAELETLGYQVNRWATQSLYFGGAHSVAVENGQTIGAGDLRRSGSVAVG